MRKLKYTKVFYHGARLKDICVGARWYERAMYRLAIYARRAVIVTLVVGAGYGALEFAGVTNYSSISYAAPIQIDRSDEILSQKIESLKGEVVETIRKCESAGHKEDDGIIIFDTNNKASIGTMQFQVNTVIHYYKKLYGKVITPKEAVLIALDNQKAGELAKDIIFTTQNMAGKDWVNCNAKYNIDAQVALIKKLEK